MLLKNHLHVRACLCIIFGQGPVLGGGGRRRILLRLLGLLGVVLGLLEVVLELLEVVLEVLEVVLELLELLEDLKTVEKHRPGWGRGGSWLPGLLPVQKE